MAYFMENRVFPDNTRIRLYSVSDEKFRQPMPFVLRECIGTGTGCVAYDAVGEEGIPVRLKQFRPAGVDVRGEAYLRLSERFVQAYRQQLEMMTDERTSAVTSGLCGLYRDESGLYWTSVNAMFGRTLDKYLSDRSFGQSLKIIHRIAEAVKAYHDAGWLLLDIKPSNILVIDSLGMKGINFFDFDSFIRISELEQAVSERRRLLLSSSEFYSAPELLEREVDLSEVSTAADIYSVGAILFTALFGRAPDLLDSIPEADYDYSESSLAEGEAADAALRAELTDFLHHTLSMSPADRFENDDMLLDALGRILRMYSGTAPKMIRSVPGAVAGFQGRSAELERLGHLLEASARPIVVSGMAGIGKTQLVLSLAEKLRDRYDFCYTAFKGSLRETLLAVPFENLREEIVLPDGSVSCVPEEELYRRKLAAIRESESRRTVLIIDNFDCPNDEDTPSLAYDQDLAEFESLPLRLIFTSRGRFDSMHTERIEELDNDAMHAILAQALPEAAPQQLSDIIEAAGGHTLTLRLIADTVREEYGRISVEQILAMLQAAPADAADGPVVSRLHGVFRAADMSRSSASALACACLFPARGISSELLAMLFSHEQWAALSRLERSGWLRYDQQSGLWSIHPLIRAVCSSEPKTRVDWDNVGSFVSALKKAEHSGSFENVGAAERRQLDELFAAVGRLNLRKKPKKRILAAAAAALIALLVGAFFLFHKPDSSPRVMLSLFFSETAAGDELEHDCAVIRDRLRNLGFSGIAYDEESLTLTASCRGSVFEGVSDMNDAVRLLISRPCELTAYTAAETVPIPRDRIVSAKAEFGSIPGISRQDLRAAEIYLPNEYAYLRLELSDEAVSELSEYLAPDGMLLFGFDGMRFESRIIFAAAFPGTEEGCWYIADGRWNSLTLMNAVALLLENDVLYSTCSFHVELDPAADWIDPAEIAKSARGRYQCSVEELPDGTVTLVYEASSADEISDSTFEQAVAEFCERLDKLRIPYAIGTDWFRDRCIIVRMPPETLSYGIVNYILPTKSANLRSEGMGEESLYQSVRYDYSADILASGDGTYCLTLHTEDDYALSRLLEATSGASEENEGVLYLSFGSYLQILSTRISAPVEAGEITFSEMPFLGRNSIGEEELPLLELLCHIINSNGSFPTYNLNYDKTFFSEGAEFGLKRMAGKHIADRVTSAIPTVKAWVSQSSLTECVYISLGLAEEPGFIAEAAGMVRDIMEKSGLEQDGSCDLLIYVTDENERERFRISVDRTDKYSTSEHPYSINAIIAGDRIDQYYDEIESVFMSDSFYSERGFYIWKVW